jgi:hypothetical protein
MKKIISIIFLIALLAGCGASAPHNQWKSALKFFTPPDRTDQDRVIAENDCIKEVDEAQPEGMVFLKGAAWHYQENSYRYQDCMAAKGFPCMAECAYDSVKYHHADRISEIQIK